MTEPVDLPQWETKSREQSTLSHGRLQGGNARNRSRPPKAAYPNATDLGMVCGVAPAEAVDVAEVLATSFFVVRVAGLAIGVP